MAALTVTRQPAFHLTVVASLAQAVTFQVVGKWRLAVVEAAPLIGAAIPVLSKDGIHSLVFGGQVVTGS